jgi:MFS family permease
VACCCWAPAPGISWAGGRVFLAGLAVFVLASFLIGVAPTGWWLIAARALQGVGAAVVAPSSLSLLTATFAGRQRTRAVAAYGTVAGIGASVGLVVGGAAADLISWRTGCVGSVVFGIVRSTDAGWTDPITLTALAAGGVLLALLVRNETRAEQPIMPLHLSPAGSAQAPTSRASSSPAR